ncbi:potassium channel family protein [Pleurocapsa sp. PCC 7319]|uniref:potassium channel family protein n=1 Tax=Pleurocapsa sp. PCC 7319 TaxID=118161 RepID=UPI0003457B7A|nr:potassium channel family protein [Pleurocapsa sp. PCC 7319]
MKPLLKSKVSSNNNKYTQLLIALIANFVLAPFLRGNRGELALSLISLYAIIIIVKTFSLNPKFFRLYSGIALLTFLLEIVGRMELYGSWRLAFLLLIQVVYIFYLGMAIYLILRDILLSQEITIDTIRGGICVYLLIGFVWALLYGITASLDSNAFSQPIVEIESYGRAVYFSFTTLTTLGYGDIIPVSPLAKMLTNLEAIIGQLYPAILIAILVGSYISQRSK